MPIWHKCHTCPFGALLCPNVISTLILRSFFQFFEAAVGTFFNVYCLFATVLTTTWASAVWKHWRTTFFTFSCSHRFEGNIGITFTFWAWCSFLRRKTHTLKVTNNKWLIPKGIRYRAEYIGFGEKNQEAKYPQKWSDPGSSASAGFEGGGDWWGCDQCLFRREKKMTSGVITMLKLINIMAANRYFSSTESHTEWIPYTFMTS